MSPATFAPETDAQMLARLIHTGGKILVVGGGVSELPKQYIEHPALLLWDDNQQGTLQKDVPSNVRAILWNRWISHAMAGRLNLAAKQLRALKFPMLRTREIKMLLSEIVQEERSLPELPASDVKTTTERFDRRVAEQERQEQPIQQEPTQEMVKAAQSGNKKGTMQAFIAKHINLQTDWKVRGSIAHEGARLFTLAEKEGLETTQESIKTAVGILVRSLGHTTSRSKPDAEKRTSKKRKTTRTAAPSVRQSAATSKDDFDQLDSLLSDAITALQLVQEHMPKVKKETERLRGMREKMLKMLED